MLEEEFIDYYHNKEAELKELFSDEEINNFNEARGKMWQWNRKLFLLTESPEFKQAAAAHVDSINIKKDERL